MSRHGSILLLCLAIIASLSLLAYGFVRVVQLHNEGSGSVNRQVLARETALMGLNHAVEQIVRDYASEPFTRMDGPAHATFLSHTMPYSINGYGNRGDNAPGSAWVDQRTPGGSIAADVDDVSAERTVSAPTKDVWWSSWCDPWGSYNLANCTYDGRGRYFEPDFYNPAGYVAASGATPPLPAVPVRFGTDLTAADPLPGRSGGIFLDEHWKRITGDPRAARSQARYRLRYAVGVMDLDGELLVNPDPAIDPHAFASANPADYADPLRARVVRAQHAIGSLAWVRTHFGMSDLDNANEASGLAGGMGAGPRLEHVFLGRGFTSNYDSSAAKNFAPMTFPLSYRPAGGNNLGDYLKAYPGTNVDGVIAADDLYEHTGTSPAVAKNKAGGELVGYDSSSNLNHVLAGPQYSFWNFDMATAGGGGEGANQWDGTVRSVGCFTPFGRGLLAGANGRYSGHVDTPFAVNLMTAPGIVLTSMVAAYMPPGAFTVLYHSQVTPGKSYFADLNGARDLFVGELSPAFSRYAAPARSVPAITPDYHVAARHLGDVGYRAPEKRYPGVLAFNGYAPGETGAHEWSNDSLGRYLRATGTPAAPVKAGVVDAAWSRAYTLNTSASATAKATSPTSITMTVTNGGSRYSSGTTVTLTGGTGTVTGVTPTIVHGVITAITVTGASGYTVNDTPVVAISDTVPIPISGDKVFAARDPYSGFCLWQRYDPWQGATGYGVTLKPSAFPNGTPMSDSTKPSVTWDRWVIGTHPDSIWEAVGQAMAATIAVARGQWLDYPTDNADPRTFFNNGPWTDPTKRVRTVQDLDALFLANLGIDIANPTGTAPTTAWTSAANGGVQSFTPAWNLASLAVTTFFADDFGGIGPGTYTPGSAALPYTAIERTQAMELIINDLRLSFFGSSPAYRDDFRALDLNGDGKVACSGIAAMAADPLDPAAVTAVQRESDLGIDQYAAGASAAVTSYFSSTGVFTMQKSRFWRIMVRGEVWDNLLKSVVTDAMLDSVICVDPVDAANEFGAAGTQNPAGGQYSTHSLYQRWHFDKFRGQLPRHE